MVFELPLGEKINKYVPQWNSGWASIPELICYDYEACGTSS
jgi:hypothetical protein